MLTPQVMLFVGYAFLATSAWAFPVSVIPLFVDEHSSSSTSAGLVTGLMFLITVLVELRTPHLMHSLGNKIVLPTGAALMGVAPVFFFFTNDVWAMVAVPIARGAGLALLVVAATATAARLFPAGRRAEGLGLFGLSFTVPSVLLTPAGIWLADHFGYGLVFGVSIALGAMCIALAPLIPADADEQDSPHGILGIIKKRTILVPTIVFGISTLAAGVIITYLALAVGEGVAAIGLFLYGVTSSIARWLGGRWADAIGSGMIFWWGMLVSGLGVAMMAATSVDALVLIGLTVFGLGFGAVQNASIAVMFARAERRHVAHISVLWNLAFDAGLGIGAVGFGLIAAGVGYSGGFLVLAVVTLLAVIPAWRDRRLNEHRQ